MERGAVTDSYTLDRQTVLKLLNEALATEIVCVLRYKAHYYMASGINAKSVAAEFLEHANEEQGHADQIAERITQLDGTPNFSPDGLSGRSHSEFVVPDDLAAMIEENLIAERIAIDSYREIINYIGDRRHHDQAHARRDPRGGGGARRGHEDADGGLRQEGRTGQACWRCSQGEEAQIGLLAGAAEAAMLYRLATKRIAASAAPTGR